ncbi:MAG: TonB-dependent receptor [Candidatus Aminicenantes bacterium]|jgi:hypothetical protein
MKKIFVLCVTILFFTGFSIAQKQYGNIRGIVTDEEGNPLPGVTVTLESELYNPRSVLTTEGGIFRFLNVSVGLCRVKCELSGFRTYRQENIDMRVGGNVDLRIVLEPGTLEEEVTVVAVSPVVDMKKTGTALNVTQEMLQEIPSARDPWVILQRAPGMLVTRENVGGSESGQQPYFLSRASVTWNNMWNMDGVPITDMASAGASPMYYDFDTFEEMQVVTSGQDASIQTGGISINFITRRGTNKYQVMGRAFFTNDDLQGDNRTQELKDLDYVGNQINQIMDYGLQLGGPFVKDRFWFWLGYGVQDIKHVTIAGYPDNTILKGFNSKLNFQISRRNRAELAFIRNTKTKFGRAAGPTRPPETTWDQEGYTNLIKLEDEHVFSDNFLLTLKLAYQGNRWSLTPQGGMDVQPGFDLYTGIFSGSWYYLKKDQPSYGAKLDGNYYMEDVLGGNHEIKFGVEYRLTPVKETRAFAGDALKYYWDGVPLFAEMMREGIWDYKSNRISFYINDVFTAGRLTVNLGFRVDREDCTNNEASVKASKVAPDLLPASTFPGYDPDVIFLTFSPRIGFTYDLTDDGKTILRGNVARYSSQIGPYLSRYTSASKLARARYYWTDVNGDDLVSTDELHGYPTDGLLWFTGFDPWNPEKFESPNAADRNLKPEPTTDELILGVERELLPDFSLSANLIFRRNHHYWQYAYYDKESGTIITPEDYIGPYAGSIIYDGKTYNYEYWTLNQYRLAGRYVKQNPDYHENYTCFEVSAVKRLRHRWMINVSFIYQIHTQHFGDEGFLDPTNIEKLDGSRWAANPIGFKYNLWPNPDWIAKLSFLYQLPWGFNVSCFANARQGFSYPQWIEVSSPERGAVGLGGTVPILTEKLGERRHPNFYNVDLSLMKNIHLGDYGTISLQVDAFNVFNFAHTLGRFPQINSPRHNEIENILNPRVIRFGLRYRF